MVVAAIRDGLVPARDERETSDQRFDAPSSLINIIPRGIWGLSINVGFSRREMPRVEGVAVRQDGGCLRGDRRARVSHAISLRRLVAGERALRTRSGIDCLEPVRIGDRRVGGESLRPLLHAVVASFQTSLVGAKVVCTIRCHVRVETDLLDCPPVTLLAIALQLLDRLSTVGKDEELCHAGC